MSNGQSESLPGGGSTISLSPGDGTNIYQHQGRYIVANIQMGTGITIPTGATINFMKGTSKNSSGFLSLFGEPDATQVPIVINASDPTKGVAQLCVRHDPEDTTNSIKVYASAGGGWGAVMPPADAAGVSYNVLTYDPTVTISNPTKTLLSQPSVADGDELTPSDQGGKYTTQVSCTVVDSTVNPPQIADYVVDWSEGSISLGLFNSETNTYLSETATYAERLQPGDGWLIEDSNGGYRIRMVTDSHGVANVYMVAKNTSLLESHSVTPQYDFTDFTPDQYSFLIVNVGDTKVPSSSPAIDQEKPVNGAHGTQNQLDFDDLEDPPNVQVTINPYNNQRRHDQLYLVVNGAIVAGPHRPFTDPDDTGWQWTPTFPDSLCYSDSGPHAGQLNSVLFVVSNPDSGELLPSAINNFYGKGPNESGLPPAGPLKKPKLSPAQTLINQSYLKAYGVTIEVDFPGPDDTDGWTPKAGDVLSAIAFLKGWKTNGVIAKYDLVNATNVTLNADTASKTSITLTFPDKTRFMDYDSQAASPYGNSMCYIIYTVQATGQLNPLNSHVLSLRLNTANRS